MNLPKMLIASTLIFPAWVMAQQDLPGEWTLQKSSEMQERSVETAEREPGMRLEQPAFLTRLEPDQVLANDLIGSSIRTERAPPVDENGAVIGREGADVGAVGDLILGDDGRVVGVTFDVGGFLGIGAREVALNWGLIEVQRDPENPDVLVLMADVTPDGVRDAPEFDRDPDYEGTFN